MSFNFSKCLEQKMPYALEMGILAYHYDKDPTERLQVDKMAILCAYEIYIAFIENWLCDICGFFAHFVFSTRVTYLSSEQSLIWFM